VTIPIVKITADTTRLNTKAFTSEGLAGPRGLVAVDEVSDEDIDGHAHKEQGEVGNREVKEPHGSCHVSLTFFGFGIESRTHQDEENIQCNS
jgi:hypothetical protein